MRLPETKLDLWTQNATQLFCQDEVETRIRAKAAKLAAECRRLRTAGLQVPLLEVDDLVNQVWVLALKTRPDFPDRTGMILYFWRRMENLFKDKCRKSAAARTRSLSLDGEAEEAARADRVLSLDKFRENQVERENLEALQGFHAFLALHDHKLLPLLNLITMQKLYNPREQAEKLGLQVKDIYRLRARLQLQAERYGSSLKSKR